MDIHRRAHKRNYKYFLLLFIENKTIRHFILKKKYN